MNSKAILFGIAALSYTMTIRLLIDNLYATLVMVIVFTAGVLVFGIRQTLLEKEQQELIEALEELDRCRMQCIRDLYAVYKMAVEDPDAFQKVVNGGLREQWEAVLEEIINAKVIETV